MSEPLSGAGAPILVRLIEEVAALHLPYDIRDVAERLLAPLVVLTPGNLPLVRIEGAIRAGAAVVEVAGVEVVRGDPAILLALIEDRLYERAAAAAPHHLLLHGSAVAHGDECAVLVGPTFSGKTTLAFRFVERGLTYLSDEVAPVEHASGLVRPFPRPLNARDDDLYERGRTLAGLTPFAHGEGERAFRRLVPAAPIRADLCARFAPVLIAWLDPAGGAGRGRATLRSTGPAEKVLRITEAAFNFHGSPRTGFDAACDLASRVPLLRVAGGDVSDRVDALAAWLARERGWSL